MTTPQSTTSGDPWAEVERLKAERDELRLNYDRVRAAFEKQTIECVQLRAQLAAKGKVWNRKAGFIARLCFYGLSRSAIHC